MLGIKRYTTYLSSELQVRALVVDAGCALKHLHNRLGAVHLQHLATPGGAIAQLEVDNLCVLGLLQKQQDLLIF